MQIECQRLKDAIKRADGAIALGEPLACIACLAAAAAAGSGGSAGAGGRKPEVCRIIAPSPGSMPASVSERLILQPCKPSNPARLRACAPPPPAPADAGPGGARRRPDHRLLAATRQHRLQASGRGAAPLHGSAGARGGRFAKHSNGAGAAPRKAPSVGAAAAAGRTGRFAGHAAPSSTHRPASCDGGRRCMRAAPTARREWRPGTRRARSVLEAAKFRLDREPAHSLPLLRVLQGPDGLAKMVYSAVTWSEYAQPLPPGLRRRAPLGKGLWGLEHCSAGAMHAPRALGAPGPGGAPG